MKLSRSLILVVALFLISSGFTMMQSYKKHFIGDKIEVIFSRNQDFNELVKIKSDLGQNAIIINYQLLRFDDNGKLKEIEFRVIGDGKYCGSGSSKALSDERKFGFIIDRSPNAEFYFQVGNLWTK